MQSGKERFRIGNEKVKKNQARFTSLAQRGPHEASERSPKGVGSLATPYHKKNKTNFSVQNENISRLRNCHDDVTDGQEDRPGAFGTHDIEVVSGPETSPCQSWPCPKPHPFPRSGSVMLLNMTSSVPVGDRPFIPAWFRLFPNYDLPNPGLGGKEVQPGP
jgi:hypothetical protein